ncbi:MAG: ATP/GTP-binding protein [Adhaeribacter sp.]|nr:ATP/GTP-binding protein [Adhaeribacter sp.]
MGNLKIYVKSIIAGALLSSVLWSCAKPVMNTLNIDSVTLTKKWETDGVLLTPESVLYDKGNNILYVANINGQAGDKDGNGSIGRVSIAGKVEEAEWVQGLDAPKGMGLHKGLLYVADLTKVVVIDTKSGQKVREIELPGAQFLNDVTVDNKGIVYISDSSGKKVYQLQDNVPSVYLESNVLQRPNGLLAHQNKMYLIDMPTGLFYEINENKELIKRAEGLVGGDGIVPVGAGDFLISNWNGEVSYVTASGKVKKLIDTKEAKINAADIEFIPALNLVLVPTFFNNKVMAYQLGQ